MHRMIATFFSALFLFVFPAAQVVSAFPQGDSGNPGSPPFSHEETSSPSQQQQNVDFSEGLTVTLKIPRNSPFLSKVSLSDIEKADNDKQSDEITLEVPVSSEKYASLPVANIGEEPLTLGEYRQALEPTEDEEGKTYTVAGQDPMEVLNRYRSSARRRRDVCRRAQ